MTTRERSAWVIRQAGEVDHGVDTVERVRRNVADVGSHELDAIREVCQRRLPPPEIVEHADEVAALEQALGQDAADVAGAARH
jgi:hypothetical protein